MRLLHTSDWHLGHTLKDVTREHEHAAFLAWLVETLGREQPDVLVITGDVFDSATPPASAERMWFEFLAAARRMRPAMDIVAIAGNHDSPARLAAAASVLRELGVHVIGGLPRRGDALDLDRILIPVAGGRGLVAAVPFLRPIDLTSEPVRRSVGAAEGGREAEDGRARTSEPVRRSVGAAEGGREAEDGRARIIEVEDPLAAVYAEVVAEAGRRRAPGQALVVLGHLYVTGADPSLLSERRISIGGQESGSLRMFPPEIDYVALGHMHRAQRVGRESIRYAGAPIALALDEASYRHQVVVVDFAGGRVADTRALLVPQTIDIVRIPARGAAPLADVLAAIDALPPREGGDDPARPYLELAIALDRPEPRLRTVIETALDGKRPRLVQMRIEQTGSGAALGDRVSVRRLAELDPRDVFAQIWARDHAEPPSPAVIGAFERLLAEVRGDVEDPAAPEEQAQLRLGGVA